MLISWKRNLTQVAPLRLHTTPLEQVNTLVSSPYHTCHGPATLTWSAIKPKKLLGLLYRHFYNHVEPSVLWQLYLTVIRPTSSTVWDLHLLKDQKILENTKKFALKICMKCWSNNYTYYDLLQIPKLSDRRSYLKLCFYLKFLMDTTIFLWTLS